MWSPVTRGHRIFNDERDPRENLKDIPTFKEMGYDVTMSVWKFLMLPAGTPEDVVTKVTETLTAITETDEYKEFCDANQLLPLTLTTEEMVERINEEAAVNQEACWPADPSAKPHSKRSPGPWTDGGPRPGEQYLNKGGSL